jgi:hypothetical protein
MQTKIVTDMTFSAIAVSAPRELGTSTEVTSKQRPVLPECGATGQTC